MPTSSSANSLSMSWRTDSAASSSTTRSVDLTRQSPNKPHEPSRIFVVPADTMGMKFPSWREPKPLRQSRPNTGTDTDMRSTVVRPHSYSVKDKNLLSRLSKPTTATKLKTIEFNRRINFIDSIKYFSWSNMKLYQDQTKMFYTRNGGLRYSSSFSSRPVIRTSQRPT